MTIGTWRVLYLTEVEKRQHCMCQCVHCGIKKFIEAFKFRKGYALRCPECRIRQELVGIYADAATSPDESTAIGNAGPGSGT